MNRTLLLTFILFLYTFVVARAADASSADNVVICEELHVCTLQVKDGVLCAVKSVEETTYTALHSDGFADALTMYNDNVTIDKASAPGAKPYYRSLEATDAFYSGSRVCYMRVPVEKGKKVKAVFHQTYKAPEHFCDVFLMSPYRKIHSRTVIKVPPSLAGDIRVRPFGFIEGMSLSSDTLADGSVIHTVEAQDLPAWRYEEDAPSSGLSMPRLIVTGQFSDVKALYRHFRKYVDDGKDDDAGIRDLAAELSAKAADRFALIDSIAYWVRRNIRYLAVEHGEYAFRPAPAAEVLVSRTGDCKGSANLIKSLLRHNGLDGRLVWTGTNGEIPFDWDSVPALCAGNHVIAACVFPDTTVFIDGTASWASPGYIPPSIRGRRVMIEDGEDCILTNVPDSGHEWDREDRRADFRISGNDLVGHMSVSMSGVMRMAFLSAYASLEPRDKVSVASRLVAYPRKNSVTDSVEVKAPLAGDRVTVGAQVTEKNAAKKVGDRIYLDLKPVRDMLLEVVDTAGRVRDYMLPYGYSSAFEYTVEIPEGYTVERLPAPLSVDDEWYSASVRYSVDGSMLRCVAAVSPKTRLVPLKSIAERNRCVKAIRRASDSQLALVSAQQK